MKIIFCSWASTAGRAIYLTTVQIYGKNFKYQNKIEQNVRKILILLKNRLWYSALGSCLCRLGGVAAGCGTGAACRDGIAHHPLQQHKKR